MSDVPRAVDVAVRRALAKKREDRFLSMEALREALGEACAKAGGTKPTRTARTMARLAKTPAPTTFRGAVGEARAQTRSRMRWLAICGAVAAFALGASGAWTLARRTHVSAVMPAATVVATPRGAAVPPRRAPESPPPVAEPVLPAARVEVEILVETVPPDAALRLDGKPVISPIRAPRSSEAHRLRVEAMGYVPAERELRFAEDARLRFALEREAPAPATRRRPVPRPTQPSNARVPALPSPPKPASPVTDGLWEE